MRTLAIGDIHGCHRALACLLGCVKPADGDDFVFLGDYVDRGPASPRVIETLLSLAKTHRAIFLRGNHEAMMLDGRGDPLKTNIWRLCGGRETIESYASDDHNNWAEQVPQSHWDFLGNTRRFFETETHIFVHACLDPELDLKDQADWVLFWDLFEGIKPHKSAKKVICGHTAQETGLIKDLGFAACIDTGAAYGGWLTCLDVQSNRYFQANELGETRQGTL
jgi:serine/threonine protein phosphatase 1